MNLFPNNDFTPAYEFGNDLQRELLILVMLSSGGPIKRYRQLVETGRLRADSHQKGTSSTIERNTLCQLPLVFSKIFGQRANNSRRGSPAEIVLGSLGL